MPDISRRHWVEQNTIYRWKSNFGGMEVSEAKRLRELEEENLKLKRFLAEAEFDKVALKELVEGTWRQPQITNFLDPYCSDPNLLYFAGRNLCVDTHFAVFGPHEAGEDAVYAFANMRPVRRAKATLLRDGDVIRAVIETRIRNR